MELSKEKLAILEKYIKYNFPLFEDQDVKSKIDDFIRHKGSPWKALSEAQFESKKK